MADQERKPNLKVGTEWIPVEILSEPYVVMTIRGFAPVVDVKLASVLVVKLGGMVLT